MRRALEGTEGTEVKDMGVKEAMAAMILITSLILGASSSKGGKDLEKTG